MAYTEFTLENVGERLGLTVQIARLFDAVADVRVPQWLPTVLARGELLGPRTELDRIGFLISPFFMALHETMDGRFSVHGGMRLDVDAQRGLTGECDYLISGVPGAMTVRLPIVTAVEAKKQEIEAGLGQCIAQTYAARLHNQARGQELDRLYGVVTTGEVWLFFRLEGDRILVHPTRQGSGNPQGVLNYLAAAVQDGLRAAGASPIA